MEVGQCYRQAVETLAAAGIENPRQEADWLLRHVSGKHRLELQRLDAAQAAAFSALLARRAKREPLQYLLGHWPFMGREIAVGPGVLVPREETEDVCRVALDCIKGKEAPVVLDLCAGSGAIALAIQDARPDAVVTAVEYDAEAFRWLEENLRRKAAEGARAPLGRQADARTVWRGMPDGQLDLLVSNPPYVTGEEYAALEPELRYEPKQALVAGENGLFFYRLIARHFRRPMRPGGALVLEVGEGQAGDVEQLLHENGWDAPHSLPDRYGRLRAVQAVAPRGNV